MTSPWLVSYMVHRGHVDASGYYFDVGLVGEQQARIRITSLWRSGCRVWRAGADLVLILPAPENICSERALALPLTQESGPVYVALDLQPKLLQKMTPAASSVVLARHGEIQTLPLDHSEDPAEWIDLSAYSVIEGKPLSQPKPPPVIVEQQQFDARSKFEAIPEQSKAMLDLLERWRKAQEAKKQGVRGDGPSALSEFFKRLADLFTARKGADSGSPQSAASPTGSFLAELVAWFVSRFGRKSDGTGMTSTRQTMMVPTKPTPNQRALELSIKMQAFASMLLSSLGLMSFLQAQQARYLSKMISLLTRGDWAEALKYAIPIGKPGETTGDAMAFLGMLFPRNFLNISFGRPTSSPPVYLEQDLFEQLRNLYRRAFEHMAAAGKVDEAAFILAELLQNTEEAVQFLERHGRLQVAAELAEARNLRPGIVVRQWFVAGNIERAVNIARLKNAFAEAVTLLEKDRRLADSLRTFWANSLAEAGDYAGAVEAVWPIPEFSHLVKTWLKLALAAGGTSSGQLLARYLSRDQESYQEIEPLITALLSDRERERAPARMAFLDTLISASKAAPQIIAVTRAATRSVLLDIGYGFTHITKNKIKRITQFSGDRTMWADISGASYPKALPKLQDAKQKIRFAFEENDSGTKPLYDGAFLPTGQAIVALGEGGIYILNKDGKVLRHLLDPAQHLVLSDTADRAIAVADRDEAKRLTIIDILKRTAQDRGETIIDVFAKSYDGALWVASGGGELMVLDVSKPQIKALWRMPGLTGDVMVVERDQKNCSFMTYGLVEKDSFGRQIEPKDMWERWTCDALDLQLRNRWLLDLPVDPLQMWKATSPRGTFVELYVSEGKNSSIDQGSYISNNSTLRVFINGSIVTGRGTLRADPALVVDFTHGGFSVEHIRCSISNQWLALTLPIAGGSTCFVLFLDGRREVMRIHLAGASKAIPRIKEDTLTLVDDRGRFLAFDLIHGTLLRNLRIS